MKILDCTLRDGGYYNNWDFSRDLIEDYLVAMAAARVSIVEMGFRFLNNQGFKGACAYATDDFLSTFRYHPSQSVSVMVNGADLCGPMGREAALEQLFPRPAAESPVDLVRFACHYREIDEVLPAVGWLHDRGYRIGFNLMQISDRSREEVDDFARKSGDWPVEALYFADSMGSLQPDDAARIIGWLRKTWDGPLGVHTHDNMGLALSNSLSAVEAGATWMDATVTGMGRGPGNARTEELVIEAEALGIGKPNMVPLMALIRKYFGPMKAHYGWGSNPYYFLAGKYGIHPTYIQEMLSDPRYSEEDLFAVIDHLRTQGGKKFNVGTMQGARQFYDGPPSGEWSPETLCRDREVLVLGSGPGAARHRMALESYIEREKPLVVALNTQSPVSPELIDLRIACHPIRLLADAETHASLPQPLVMPHSMLAGSLRDAFEGKEIYDYGIGIEPGKFTFEKTHCTVPTSLVLDYAIAMASSGGARRVLMAGFDGYGPGDTRNAEVEASLEAYMSSPGHAELLSITPTAFRGLPVASLYAL